MHLLLPPSEAKTPGGRGRPLREREDDTALSRSRQVATAALTELVAGDPQRAADALLLPDGVAAAALRANAAVTESRTTPALRRYSGVVYDGLGFAALTPAEQRLASRSIWVFSGLFGIVRGDEPVPDYRVPAKAVLPGVGVAGTFWRPVLDEVVPTLLRRGMIVDLRSGDYAAMWRARGALAARTITVRVLSPAPRGGHAVISYNSKFGKGQLAAALVRRAAAGDPVAGVADLAAAWQTCGGVDCVERPDVGDSGGTGGAVDLYTS